MPTVGKVLLLFRLQKYKKFESNSQLERCHFEECPCCFGCKSTKNLRAIHNSNRFSCVYNKVVSAAKVQKIWEQFTTDNYNTGVEVALFRLQKYKKFESNSQHSSCSSYIVNCCFGCKSTKNLRAIHNENGSKQTSAELFRLQKYKKFESNSQHNIPSALAQFCCFGCKSTKNLRAIHN